MLEPTIIKYKVYKAGIYKGVTYSTTFTEFGEVKPEIVTKDCAKLYPDLHFTVSAQLNKDLRFYKDSLEHDQLIKVFINGEFYRDFIV